MVYICYLYLVLNKSGFIPSHMLDVSIKLAKTNWIILQKYLGKWTRHRNKWSLYCTSIFTQVDTRHYQHVLFGCIQLMEHGGLGAFQVLNQADNHNQLHGGTRMLYPTLKTALLKSILTLLYFYSVEHDSFLFFILGMSHCLFFQIHICLNVVILFV